MNACSNSRQITYWALGGPSGGQSGKFTARGSRGSRLGFPHAAAAAAKKTDSFSFSAKLNPHSLPTAAGQSRGAEEQSSRVDKPLLLSPSIRTKPNPSRRPRNPNLFPSLSFPSLPLPFPARSINRLIKRSADRWSPTRWSRWRRRRILRSAPPPVATPRPATTATPPRRRSGAADPTDQSRCATRAGSGTARGGGWPWGWTRRPSGSPRETTPPYPRLPQPKQQRLLVPRRRRRRRRTRPRPGTRRPARRRRPPRRPRRRLERTPLSFTWWGSPRTRC